MPLVPAALLALVLAGAAPPLDGDWDARLDVRAGITLPLTLHIRGATATVDSPDQNALGMPATLTLGDAGAVTVDLAGAGARITAAESPDGAALEGTFTQGGASLPVRFTRRAAGAPAPAAPDRPQTPRPPFPYVSEEVRFAGGEPGLQLAGTVTRPPGPGPFAAVVLIAGSGAQARDEVVAGHRVFGVIADRLTRAGLLVLRYDKRSVGASGKVARPAVLDDYAADARGALAYLRTRPDVRADRIGLLGHSEGGEVAPMVAAADGRVAFLVLLGAPAVAGDRVLAAQVEALARATGVPEAQARQSGELEGRLLRTVVAAPEAEAEATAHFLLLAAHVPEPAATTAAREAASPWLRAFVRTDPAVALGRLHQPVLALYGGKDVQVVAAVNAPAMRAALAGDTRADVRELPGLNHLFQPAGTGAPAEYGRIPTTIDEGALALIADWAAKQGR